MQTKKTLQKIIAIPLLAGMLSGCAGLGAVYMQSDDPATRAMGTLMYNQGSHEQRMKEAEVGRSQVNVNVGRNNPCEFPENIYVTSEGEWRPIPGYTWITKDPYDLRVKPIE